MPERQTTTRVSDETTVGEALLVVPGADEVFRRHGCDATVECTAEHHRSSLLVDTSLTCHIDDTDALIADLNAALEAEERTWAPAPDLAATPIAELLARYPALQPALDGLGLGSCCGGHLTLAEAAGERDLSLAEVITALRRVVPSGER